MASRILFEDDIKVPDLNESIKIKAEHTPDEGKCDQEHETLGKSQLSIAHDQNLTKETETRLSNNIFEVNNDLSTCNGEGNTDQVDLMTKSVIILGKKQPADTSDTNCETEGGNQGKIRDDSGNTDKSYEVPIEVVNDEGIIGQNCFIFGKPKTTPIVKTNGNKNVKKRPSELELLGIDVKVNDEAVEYKYDVFGDDSKIYRKYNLRKTEQPISYKEPKEFKPQELIPKRDSSDDENKTLICSVCSLEFDSKRALQLHMHYHRTVREYKCAICSKTFEQNSDLIAHKSTHTESFLCKRCKVAFSDHCDFLQHNLLHTNQTQFKCPECGLSYGKYSYRVHIFTHFDKKVSCPICPFTTNGQFNLNSHINQHKYKLTCVECGKNFNNKKNYEYHMSMHTGVKKYQCFYCGKGFRNLRIRTVHTRIHTDERPYSCDICGHKFRQSGDLKKHKSTHESEKKFSCDHCNKKFYRDECLRLHMRRHTRKNLYECPECDGTFTSASGLKTHTMYKHLTDRPVNCKVCDKKFVNQNAFQKHARSLYHKRNMFACVTKKEK